MTSVAEQWLASVAAADTFSRPPDVGVSVAAWLDAHPVSRARQVGSSRVAHDTPWTTAYDLASQAWMHAPADFVWWGDPCAGIGRLLLAGWETGLAQGREPGQLLRTLVASDTDATALSVAREAMARAAVVLLAGSSGHAANAVQIARAWQQARWLVQDAVEVLATVTGPGVVLTNPPFVSMRTLHRTIGVSGVSALRHQDARLIGAFDLGVPIVLAALDAAAGGAAGLVLPAPWRSVGYAAPLRAQMAGWGQWQDRAAATFRADVHTWTVIGHAAQATSATAQRVHGPPSLVPAPAGTVDPGLPPGVVPLAQIAEVRGGTTGFAAARVGAMLQDGEQGLDDEGWPWIATGHISPLRVIAGAARWQGVMRQRPWLPRQALAGTVLAAWYDRPRLLLTGVCRTLSAGQVTAAAQAVGVWGVATDHVPLDALACCLMVPAAQSYVLERFPGTQLRSGYVRWSAVMVRSLPVPSPEDPVYDAITRAITDGSPGDGVALAAAWLSARFAGRD